MDENRKEIAMVLALRTIINININLYDTNRLVMWQVTNKQRRKVKEINEKNWF